MPWGKTPPLPTPEELEAMSKAQLASKEEMFQLMKTDLRNRGMLLARSAVIETVIYLGAIVLYVAASLNVRNLFPALVLYVTGLCAALMFASRVIKFYGYWKWYKKQKQNLLHMRESADAIAAAIAKEFGEEKDNAVG